MFIHKRDGCTESRELLQRKRHIKIELCVALSFAIIPCWSRLKISDENFRLLGMNGFHIKAKNGIYRCGLALSSGPQTSKFHVVV